MKSKGFTLLELMIILTIIAAITALAIPNLIRAKMAANEVATIAVIKSLGTAQEMYRRTDWDGNSIKEYAQNIGPNGGQGNLESLYFNVKNSVPTGLVDSSLLGAEIPNTGSYNNTTPRNGYIFFIQSGETYPTILTYVGSSGAMTKGYGVCAVPQQYGLTGSSTFQMNSNGVVYQKDQGDNSLVAAYNINPVNNWVVSQ